MKKESEKIVRPEIQKRINHLIDTILNIPGKKVVTLLVADSESPFIIDISEKGSFGYDNIHRDSFQMKLVSAITTFGSLVIRQFLHLKIEVEDIKGESQWVPLKKVYGATLGNEQWMPLPAAEMKLAYSIDMETGQSLPSEPDIVFSEFPL